MDCNNPFHGPGDKPRDEKSKKKKLAPAYSDIC